MAELIGGYEIGAKILQTAQKIGKTTLGFVSEHIRPGAWGEMAEAIQPPHVDVEHQLGED